MESLRELLSDTSERLREITNTAEATDFVLVSEEVKDARPPPATPPEKRRTAARKARGASVEDGMFEGVERTHPI